jgi:hypothetical protein
MSALALACSGNYRHGAGFFPGRVIAPRLAEELLVACDLKIHPQLRQGQRSCSGVLKVDLWHAVDFFCPSASNQHFHIKHQIEPQSCKADPHSHPSAYQTHLPGYSSQIKPSSFLLLSPANHTQCLPTPPRTSLLRSHVPLLSLRPPSR